MVEELLAYRKRRGYRNKELIYDGETEMLKDRTGKLYNVYKRVALAVGITTNEFRSHLQRKTIATEMVNNHEESTTVQDTLGHKQIATTLDNYVVSDNHERKTEKIRGGLQRVANKRESEVYGERRIC
ncbi:MAG: site-specific integrase [Hungatella sp.]|nr:site-specific integrase [Hungatella sp.]